MYLNKIKLENFRNYSSQNVDLINGINLFLGDNAQGKTNIIESIYVCSLGKSYRTTKDTELISFGKDYCKVDLDYTKSGNLHEVNFFIDNLNRKQIKCDGIKIKKIADYVGEIPTVNFSPESLDIVKGSPSKRRSFIDMICCQLSKSYIVSIQDYTKCLKMKNTAIKKDFIDDNYMYILHEKMSKDIVSIVKYRKNIIEKLKVYAKTIENKLTEGMENIELSYVTDFIDMNEEEVYKYLNEHLYIDKLRKSSIKGIQRDDMEVLVNDREVSKYGSQGQKRTALLTLKLANFELLKEEKNETPILLLDDIMSELDSTRINFLLKYIEKYQSIITTTEDTFASNISNIKFFKVSNGTLET